MDNFLKLQAGKLSTLRRQGISSKIKGYFLNLYFLLPLLLSSSNIFKKLFDFKNKKGIHLLTIEKYPSKFADKFFTEYISIQKIFKKT